MMEWHRAADLVRAIESHRRNCVGCDTRFKEPCNTARGILEGYAKRVPAPPTAEPARHFCKFLNCLSSEQGCPCGAEPAKEKA